MSFSFKDLTNETRRYMIEEVNYDLQNGNLYLSDRLSDTGKSVYADLLIKSIEHGDEATLAQSLIGKFNSTYFRKNPSGTLSSVKMPINQNVMLAEGEFNRFYIRALCRTAMLKGRKLKIYRAKFSTSPRLDSERKIGSFVDAQQLLLDLRKNTGTDTALGLPPGPNSGLSVELV